MQISRRNALLGAGAAAAVAGVPAVAQAGDPNLSEIQALVSDLRNCDRHLMTAVYFAFQEVADRLEALPGIVPVPNEIWKRQEVPWGKHGFPERGYLTAGRMRP